MLQQTTVATVGPYFGDFMARWPNIEALAAAPLDDVLHAWAGLGYYARARNLHACAKAVVARHGGRFPEGEADLLTLPGIGAYTAAAITAIAHDRKATVVDGNVERVMARLFGLETPLPDAKPEMRRLAATLTPEDRPGDYAQATMDLGATICTPRKPRCPLCPWSSACAARAAGNPESLPRRRPKATRPTRFGTAFWLVRSDGAVLLRRRAPRGLLGGMIEIPSTPWRESVWATEQAIEAAPVAGLSWRSLDGAVGHTFTHFHLELSVLTGAYVGDGSPDGFWVRPADFRDHALPSVMRKLAAHALAGSAAASATTRRASSSTQRQKAAGLGRSTRESGRTTQ